GCVRAGKGGRGNGGGWVGWKRDLASASVASKSVSPGQRRPRCSFHGDSVLFDVTNAGLPVNSFECCNGKALRRAPRLIRNRHASPAAIADHHGSPSAISIVTPRNVACAPPTNFSSAYQLLAEPAASCFQPFRGSASQFPVGPFFVKASTSRRAQSPDA